MVLAAQEPRTTTLADVEAAAARLQGVAYRTPLLHSEVFSQMYGCRIAFKLENLQTTGAFKLRGAYNAIASLTDAERARGLVTASSGNHAQGVAYAARAFGLAERTTIYMPESTPRTKIENTRRYGDVRIQLVAGNYDQCSELAHHEAAHSGASYIEPYNDWRVIAGQGTIGLEIIEDAPDVDVVIVPVGGGGLLAGIALAVRGRKPEAVLIGVQARYATDTGYTIADGIRVKHPGERPMQLIEQHVQRLIRIHENEVGPAVRQLAQVGHLLVEGAGAIGLAALMDGALRFTPEQRVVIVLSGGNMDLMRLAAMVEKAGA